MGWRDAVGRGHIGHLEQDTPTDDGDRHPLAAPGRAAIYRVVKTVDDAARLVDVGDLGHQGVICLELADHRHMVPVVRTKPVGRCDGQLSDLADGIFGHPDPKARAAGTGGRCQGELHLVPAEQHLPGRAAAADTTVDSLEAAIDHQIDKRLLGIALLDAQIKVFRQGRADRAALYRDRAGVLGQPFMLGVGVRELPYRDAVGSCADRIQNLIL